MTENIETEVNTSLGVFVVRRPKAGIRRKVIAKVETPAGIPSMTLMMELLPKSIKQRPDGVDKDVPIEDILDSMETPDYDKLITGLAEVMKGEDSPEEEEKKTPELKQSTDSSNLVSSPQT